MLSRRLLSIPQQRRPFVCLLCSSRAPLPSPHTRSGLRYKSTSRVKVDPEKDNTQSDSKASTETPPTAEDGSTPVKKKSRRRTRKINAKLRAAKAAVGQQATTSIKDALTPKRKIRKIAAFGKDEKEKEKPKSIKEALLAGKPKLGWRKDGPDAPIELEELSADSLDFQPVEHKIPPVPRLSYGLDRVLFNPGVYRLQDPRSRVYNFDPYLEKIMPVAEFDFDALGEYKTSSRDKDLLAMTRELKTKFTGSTSSMSGVLQHFHFMLSKFRGLNHNMLSRNFPEKPSKFSRITLGPSAIFLRYKPSEDEGTDGIYAIDADKSFDSPNIMSWMGHSMEKLLTTSREEFEKYRRSSPEAAPDESETGKCFHYSKLGNFLMRSQLDAHDSRLPGTGIFDLKTRAVVSIRMDHQEYELGSGYQLHYDQGEWESYEREFYDMTRATMLKYSLQVRMGRMDGIFVAYHNIERIFGFQYLSLPDLDNVLHGQTDTCLGDQEFKLSIALLDELLQRATAKFPGTSMRMHFESMERDEPYMYIFAEPVTEEQADEIQSSKSEAMKEFERSVIGVMRDDPEVQAEWQNIQHRVDEEVIEDETEEKDVVVDEDAEADAQTIPESTSEEQTSNEDDSAEDQEESETPTLDETKPLMGWTLVIRNRVNGNYVDRPSKLKPSDDWTIEYNIKEIKTAPWKAYEKMQARRKKLIGMTREEQVKSLGHYREMIKKYSLRGRRWRLRQDEIDATLPRHVFRPLGPGSEDYAGSRAEDEVKESAGGDASGSGST